MIPPSRKHANTIDDPAIAVLLWGRYSAAALTTAHTVPANQYDGIALRAAFHCSIRTLTEWLWTKFSKVKVPSQILDPPQ